MALPNGNVFLLDYERKLRWKEPSSSVAYVLSPAYNLDGTHVNNAILQHLELAMEQSGCNSSLL